MKTTPPIDLDQAPWLAGVEPIEAIRGLQSSDPGSSKMGWPFLWPANEPWPVCTHGPGVLASLKCDLPYLPVLQLRRDAFPDLPFPSDTDLFQLLWCPMLHFVGDDGFLLYWRRSRDVEISRSEPLPRTIHFSPIISCVLDPEKIPDYPNHLELGYLPDTTDEDGDELWGEEEWDAMNDLGPASGTKLFGFPRWEQHPDYPICPKCAKQMKLLLSIASYEFCHHSQNSRWIPLEEREALEGSSYEKFTEYCEPHGVMIGDGGDAHLFYCRCGEFTSRLQSS